VFFSEHSVFVLGKLFEIHSRDVPYANNTRIF